MTRWKLTIEYDGSGFSGWQRQAEDVTVQGTIEDAIFKFSSEKVALHVAGRTDAGVHARAQVAHFDLEKEFDSETVCSALNFYMRMQRVSVLQAEKVSEAFHARFGAVSRSYRYTVVNRKAQLALLADRAWLVRKPLRLQPMQVAGAMLLGKHDFSTFRAQHCQANSPIRTLDVLEITQDGEVFTFVVQARSFLYHQVRNIVGTLVMVGCGKWTIEQFAASFRAADRMQGGPTAPSHGLCFWHVEHAETAK